MTILINRGYLNVFARNYVCHTFIHQYLRALTERSDRYKTRCFKNSRQLTSAIRTIAFII